MGRTDFDYAAVKSIQPGVAYHYCPENLRREFIETDDIWNWERCEKYSIFMSQATYPIKGLHIALMALKLVKHVCPKVKLYIAGSNYYQKSSMIGRLKEGSYAKYINRLIREYDLENNILFIGEISASGMKEYYLRTNVFILPSIMENSPNSLMEAMSLGVPSIAADVGGVSSIMQHKCEGYLYPADEYYMLAHYILRVFKEREVSRSFSANAFRTMREKMVLKDNINMLVEIYKNILGKAEEFDGAISSD